MDSPPKKFPDELLLSIFKAMHKSFPASHLRGEFNYLRACRDWYKIGRKLFWTDICLKDEAILRFLTTDMKEYKEHLTDTQSLTVMIDPGHPRADEWCKTLSKLPARLKSMKNLSCFSFKVLDPSNGATGMYCRLSATAVRNIVKSLPTSVKHLEIDTNGYDRDLRIMGNPPFSDIHICEAISLRLTQLCSLRLSVSRLCPELISSSPYNESGEEAPISITINGCNDNGRLHELNSCDEVITPLYMPQPSKYARSVTRKRLCKELLEKFEACGREGTMSCISEALSANPTAKSYKTVLKRATKPAKTTSCPYDIIQGTIIFLRKLDEKGNDVEIQGEKKEIIAEQVEDKPWKQTIEGWRFPDKYLKEGTRLEDAEMKGSSVVRMRDL
jgi:hypothetical protein